MKRGVWSVCFLCVDIPHTPMQPFSCMIDFLWLTKTLEVEMTHCSLSPCCMTAQQHPRLALCDVCVFGTLCKTIILSGRKARGFQELKHFKGQYREIMDNTEQLKQFYNVLFWGASTYTWYSLQRKPVHLTDCRQDSYQSKSCYLANTPLSVASMHANSDGKMVSHGPAS